MNARRCTLLLVNAGSLVLAGCALKNPPVGADIMPESARAKIPGHWAGPHRSGAVVPNWIRTFGDPELTALVADAVERNPDLKAAAARVEASRAAVRIAASSLYPRIAMKGLGERQGQHLSGDIGRGINPPDFGSPGTENSGGGGLDTSVDETSQRWVYGIAAGAAWEADVWGRIRSKKAAAKAESGALEADYEFARQSLAAAVARAYFSTIEAAQQEANAQETLDLYQEYSKLTDVRKQQGFASDFDVSQIRSRTASAQEALYTAQQDLRTAEQKAAAASYVGSALRAFEDVEDALAGDYYLRKREGALGDAVSSSADSVKFGRQQLEQGQIDMFTILRLTGENLAAKVQFTQVRASRLRERVNLYLALGGDFAGTGAPK